MKYENNENLLLVDTISFNSENNLMSHWQPKQRRQFYVSPGRQGEERV